MRWRGLNDRFANALLHPHRNRGDVEIIRLDPLAFAKDQRALQDIAQLTRIAGPAMSHQLLHGLGRRPDERRLIRLLAKKQRTEERRGGQECVRTGRYRWSPYN